MSTVDKSTQYYCRALIPIAINGNKYKYLLIAIM